MRSWDRANSAYPTFYVMVTSGVTHRVQAMDGFQDQAMVERLGFRVVAVAKEIYRTWAA